MFLSVFCAQIFYKNCFYIHICSEVYILCRKEIFMKVESMNCAYTKNGNPYHKTSRGKKLGTLAGLGVGGYSIYKCAEVLAVSSSVKSVLKDILKTFPLNIKFAKSLAAWGVIGLAAGAVVDFAVNKVRKHKADKVAATENAQ